MKMNVESFNAVMIMSKDDSQY